MELTITLISIVVVGVTIRVVIRKRRKTHLISLENDLAQFRFSSKMGLLEGVIEYGDRLIWNEHLTPTILKEIASAVDKQTLSTPKLEELKLNIFNRQLRFDRVTPDIWGDPGL